MKTILIWVAISVFAITAIIVFTQRTNSDKVGQNISASAAVDIVKNQPEVKSWLAKFSAVDTESHLGGKPEITIENENATSYAVHVYERAPDRTPSFGWYEVDKSNGRVTDVTFGKGL